MSKKVIRLAKYAEDGILSEVADAEFVRSRMVTSDCVMDFSAITKTTVDFLKALFEGLDPDVLFNRLIHYEGIGETLSEWADQLKSPSLPKKSKIKPKIPSLKDSPAPIFAKREQEGEKYTPSRLLNRLRNQLSQYIEGAYPLNDPILIQSRRKLLEEDQDGHLLSQEPFIETTPQYTTAKGGFAKLGLEPKLWEFFTEMAETPSDYNEEKNLLFSTLYAHQARSIQAYFADKKDLIVATGTGSGKTECFLIPLLGKLYQEAQKRPESFALRGVRSLILYPMNALVNDQLARLRLLFGSEKLAEKFRSLHPAGRHALFGMYTGRTPYPGPKKGKKDKDRIQPLIQYYLKLEGEAERELKKLGRYPSKDLEAFLALDKVVQKKYKSGKKKGETYNEYHWDQRLTTGPLDRELLTRQEMIKDPKTDQGDSPDILVTNYSMLEYMLMRPFERPLFDQTREWLEREESEFLIILDEAHMYRGASGAEVAFLIRRLLSRLGINGKPHKYRVICTSASLGKTEEALENVRKFAADLTGKPLECFEVVVGKRKVAKNSSPGDQRLFSILAKIPLKDLHEKKNLPAMIQTLRPLIEHLGKMTPVKTEEELFALLYQLLKDHPVINYLLKETSGKAVPLEKLSQKLFPHCSSKEKSLCRKSAEVLLTLGTLARQRTYEAGLVPTRLHMMFRGLNGLYSCINPLCDGRQIEPGKPGILGKLFSSYRTHCDACDSRVFEMASCRDCGSPYLLAYCPEKELSNINFLWGETPGELEKIQILPAKPHYESSAEEIWVQLKTGSLVLGRSSSHLRSLWLPYDEKKGERETKFSHCPMCQPQSSRRVTPIQDFRTRGEAPFAALIEAQFSEQPPQKENDLLPNRGRKVLVFSDGRQKAARLAPALEESHGRDAFRQVLALAIRELEKTNPHRVAPFGDLYQAMVWVCQERGINLFPKVEENLFASHLKKANKVKTLEKVLQNKSISPTKSYARSLFRELTDNQFYSLCSLGIAGMREDPDCDDSFDSFPPLDLSEGKNRVLFRQWLRVQIESCHFAPRGAEISELTEGWNRARGIESQNLDHIIPKIFRNYLQKILGDLKKIESLEKWFGRYINDFAILRPVGDLFYFDSDGLAFKLLLKHPWLCCRSCSRIHPEGIQNVCPNCLGELLPIDTHYQESRTGYFRRQVERALKGDGSEPFGLLTAEHSAQLTGMETEEAFNKTEKYELRFQDFPVEKEPPIDILSCTTTMEVGIDIGGLTGVALRNVPPHVANYQQRAGRAGRRGKTIASVVTYAYGGTHDSYYFQEPHRMIAGHVRAPVVYIENQKVLKRHISAYLLQVFFHETIAGDNQLYQLFESMGTVEDFLKDGNLCSYQNFSKWLSHHKNRLKEELERWVPCFSHYLGMEIPQVKDTIDQSIPHLMDQLEANLPLDLFIKMEELSDLERESLKKQCEENLLSTLIERAILPRYAFPTDTVCFWVSKQKNSNQEKYKREFDYQPQRDLKIALSEFAPGRELTIDKLRFKSQALYSPYATNLDSVLEASQIYFSCHTCGYVRLHKGELSFPVCPNCHEASDLSDNAFVTPQGFAPDINIRRKYDRGGSIAYAGQATPAKIQVEDRRNWDDDSLFGGRLKILSKPQDLISVNMGIGKRGFMICPECGYAEPKHGPGYTTARLSGPNSSKEHNHPLKQGAKCPVTAKGPYYLGYKFITDVLLLRVKLNANMVCNLGGESENSPRSGRAALTSVVEALCLSASRFLQIDEGELSGNWNPVSEQGADEVEVYLYDMLPGGAGYTKQVRDHLDEVIDEALHLLKNCQCDSSCYQCLRHYKNQFIHGALDRKLALGLLEYLQSGIEPKLSKKDQEMALRPLVEYLRLKNIHCDLFGKRKIGSQKMEIPLIIHHQQGEEIWVDVHHPLVRPGDDGGQNIMGLSLDSYTLKHELPEAVAKLRL